MGVPGNVLTLVTHPCSRLKAALLAAADLQRVTVSLRFSPHLAPSQLLVLVANNFDEAEGVA